MFLIKGNTQQAPIPISHIIIIHLKNCDTLNINLSLQLREHLEKTIRTAITNLSHLKEISDLLVPVKVDRDSTKSCLQCTFFRDLAKCY